MWAYRASVLRDFWRGPLGNSKKHSEVQGCRVKRCGFGAVGQSSGRGRCALNQKFVALLLTLHRGAMEGPGGLWIP